MATVKLRCQKRLALIYKVMMCSIPLLKYRETEGVKDQQNAIDKAKGILAQPMPRSWHDRHSANIIEDPEKKKFYNRIVADKKPYFMRLIYPDLMRQYNTYIKNTDKNALREFGMTVQELMNLPELTEEQADFLRYYNSRMPVGIGDCVMNKICRRFEEEFDHYLRRGPQEAPFDYTIMKSGVEYPRSLYSTIEQLLVDYNKRVKSYVVFANYERVDEYESYFKLQEIRNEFIQRCTKACPNEQILCDIVLDLCYKKSASKRFAWDVCGEQIIQNLLDKNENKITYPTRSDDGDIIYCGERFTVAELEIGVEDVFDFE